MLSSIGLVIKSVSIKVIQHHPMDMILSRDALTFVALISTCIFLTGRHLRPISASNSDLIHESYTLSAIFSSQACTAQITRLRDR